MTTERIKEIQSKTAYPESASVQQALLQVWNEVAQKYETFNTKREMKTQFKVTESLNGWSRLETTFVVESSPRWWQFWKPKVMHQEFNGSVWLKGEVVQSYAPVVETFKTK